MTPFPIPIPNATCRPLCFALAALSLSGLAARPAAAQTPSHGAPPRGSSGAAVFGAPAKTAAPAPASATPIPAQRADAGLLSGAAIREGLRRLGLTGSVLYVAAHPDDENTHLITYLARGRGYRTAYLSLTRGDGGQNVIGSEFGDALGVIRTQELLAARRLDGASQYFSRALDFGYSKDVGETLRTWNRTEILGDVVRVIRLFRPDVVITRFSPEAGGTHGHHTASAVLALEAFRIAGDPTAYPEQLTTLKPWQPRRILHNSRGSGALPLDINGTDPVLNETFARIAARSRAMHISQGFANYAGVAESRPETFTHLAGEPATADIMDGIDTGWGRYPGGAEIGALVAAAAAGFNPEDPAASVPALLELRAKMAALPADPVVDAKRRELDGLLQACLGLTVETTIPGAEVVPGERLRLRHRARIGSSVPVRWVKAGPAASRAVGLAIDLKRDEEASLESLLALPADTPVSQPYWLRQEPVAGMARVEDTALIGRAENPPPVLIDHTFEVGGQRLVVHVAPVQESGIAVASSGLGTPTRRALEVVPPVSLRLATAVRLFAPGATRPVEVEVRAARGVVNGTAALDVPAGWTVQPPSRTFSLAAGKTARLSFQVTAPARPAAGSPAEGSPAAGEVEAGGTVSLAARATANGMPAGTQRLEISYPHIPYQVLQPAAQMKAVVLDLKTRGREVGYLPGAGDNVAEALEEMGYAVKRLSGADLTEDKLRRFDAVVLGVRAFNVRTDLGPAMPALLRYVENGGTVIAQYNRPNDLKTAALAPFPLTLSGQRVTDENASVTFLVPEHPALNTPNKITVADFEGWVQERGIYFPSQWDERFTPLLAAGDPGEEPLKGGLLVAKHGAGHFVYSGLVWFRQLPAGVPGAYRLMANLIALGN